jgi:hypothetical protein
MVRWRRTVNDLHGVAVEVDDFGTALLGLGWLSLAQVGSGRRDTVRVGSQGVTLKICHGCRRLCSEHDTGRFWVANLAELENGGGR